MADIVQVFPRANSYSEVTDTLFEWTWTTRPEIARVYRAQAFPTRYLAEIDITIHDADTGLQGDGTPTDPLIQVDLHLSSIQGPGGNINQGLGQDFYNSGKLLMAWTQGGTDYAFEFTFTGSNEHVAPAVVALPQATRVAIRTALRAITRATARTVQFSLSIPQSVSDRRQNAFTGSTLVTDFRVGTSPVKELRMGETLVWERGS